MWRRLKLAESVWTSNSQIVWNKTVQIKFIENSKFDDCLKLAESVWTRYRQIVWNETVQIKFIENSKFDVG